MAALEGTTVGPRMKIRARTLDPPGAVTALTAYMTTTTARLRWELAEASAGALVSPPERFEVTVGGGAGRRLAGTVRLRLEEDAPAVRLVVEDDGPGVPEAIVPSLFQPFVSSRGRESGRAGTGLGLAIARGIAERHGGQLHYAGPSADLGGARFELTLPQTAPLPSGS